MGGLAKFATVVAILAGVATIAGTIKSFTCPCDGSRLPLNRQCSVCGHTH